MKGIETYEETSQELRMLSSVTLDCQVTKIVMNSGSQLSDNLCCCFLFVVKIVKIVNNCKKNQKLSKMVKIVKNCQIFGQVMFPHHSDQLSQKSQVFWVALCLSKVKVPGSWRLSVQFLPVR